MKIYVDNNILSSLVGLNFTEKTAVALEKITKSEHTLITSQLTEQEMQKARDLKIKSSILFIYKTFGEKFYNKETYLATGLGDATFGSVPWGGGEVESPVLSILRQAFTVEDARHIFQALSSHSDFFLTLDEKTILRRYRENYQNIKAFCANGNMKIVNPIELVKELSL